MSKFLRQATELANFLTGSRRAADEIAKHLVLKSFADFAPKALFIAQITDDGFLTPIASFGFERLTFASWGRFPLSMHIPITDAVRNDRCIVIDSTEDFLNGYPVLNEIENLSLDWEAVIAWPMLPFGVGFAMLDRVPTLDEQFEPYLRLTGAVIASHMLRNETGTEVPQYPSVTARKSKSTSLSNRQKVILEMLTKGATNSRIATEIGYSESLVRQETIEIYRILGVSGRKELISAAGEQ
jgi:DNA-binding CsgD family transcriptional regulator